MDKFESMEEKKSLILLHLEMLKKALEETGLAIGFNKTEDNFIFLDQEHYVKTGKFEGFQVPIKSMEHP